ncbi:MAG TPA: PilC/PilY family type IV pilus protein, partial [Burkholderiaceae bacterium]|nr:PilC/PilY family type IV pilus protein [Burkholderiaceae bacterium]
YTNAGWMVAVSSGYQNTTGTGHIWLLDPRNGNVIKRLDVPDNGGASAANPIGLASMEVFFQSDREQLVQQLYATDLRGNVWRFDLSAAAVASWPTNATKIAAVGAPITSAPAVAVNPRDRSERWVYFGTGQVLSTADLSSGAVRTFYAVKDGGPSIPGTFATPVSRSDLEPVTPSGTAPQGAAVKGWYMDMTAGGGGQIAISPHVARGVVMWAATVPSTDPCTPGATAVFYAREMGAATNRIANGSLYVTMNAPVTKLQVAQSTQAAGGTSTQRKQLLIASTSGSDIVVDVNLRVVLTGGRSNLRFVTSQ